MFGIFKKNPLKKLQLEYKSILAEAVAAQRAGNIKGYASLMEKAEEIMKKIEELKSLDK